MKYFIAISTKAKRHLLAADNEDEAHKIASQNFTVKDLYELTENTFKDTGFIFSD